MKTYNEFIQHQLQTELDPRIPQVVDKLGLKEYAKEKGVKTPKTLATGRDVNEALSKLMFTPKSFVVKNNADSGSTAIVKDGKYKQHEMNRAHKHVFEPYGLNKFEWFYGAINPTMFIEEYLADNITDYKFHCFNGKVMFCQYIFDRSTGDTKECVIMPDKEILDYHLDENFKFSKDIEIPDNWEELLDVARLLAADWKYVRVDLYSVKNEIYVGELTFSPRAGDYPGEGQKKLGKYFI